MEEEFVSHEQAIKLKELGFDWVVGTCYDKCKMVATYSENFKPLNYNNSGYILSRPTVTHALKWFRNVKNKEVYVRINNFHSYVGIGRDSLPYEVTLHYDSFEKAESALLDYCLNFK